MPILSADSWVKPSPTSSTVASFAGAGALVAEPELTTFEDEAPELLAAVLLMLPPHAPVATMATRPAAPMNFRMDISAFPAHPCEGPLAAQSARIAPI